MDHLGAILRTRDPVSLAVFACHDVCISKVVEGIFVKSLVDICLEFSRAESERGWLWRTLISYTQETLLHKHFTIY